MKKKKSYEDENYEPFEFIFEDELPANSTKLQHSPNALTSEEIINQTEDIKINNTCTSISNRCSINELYSNSLSNRTIFKNRI